MKAKKTIRRMPPRARKLAKLQRELFSLQRRMGVIIEEVALIESELQAATTCRESEHGVPGDLRDSSGKNGAEIAACQYISSDGRTCGRSFLEFPASDCVCGE